MDQPKLHQTVPGGSITKRKKKSKQLLKEEKITLANLRIWEDKVHTLVQAKKYLQKDEEKELERLIVCWRSLCQDVASALLNHYLQGDSHRYSMASWGYDTMVDDGYECDISSNEIELDESGHDKGDTDDITRMLSRLRIDPELIHYTPEQGFYD